ncbi:hypothetical protein OSB04_016537 [Centaurea solstitialis]|uniref:Agenet domain-containing protein n=1 Tax=Centaurea solstitialis TaxID=347529 RepID=A0AA38TJA3_9ASTR|nr:hypothetical protein OSB04_016537 [Centaurea solstitialis]
MAMVITKGCLVEVSSDDPGYHGAWYIATFLDEVQLHQSKSKNNKGSTSNSKNRKKIGYLVKFVSLFEDGDPSEPLTEIVDPSFVRPLPPSYPTRNNVNNAVEEEAADYELYDVVDAYDRDGWWMGVVTEVLNDDKYMVSFESPPEELEFEKSQLRLHVDWIDGHWEIPPNKETCEAEASSQKRKRGGDENPAVVEYQQEWPFIKQSPMWATIESLELYQNPPQKPHFSPLNTVKEDSREGLAIAQLVTFANVVQRTSPLKMDDHDHMIHDRFETLVELESHGFDVDALRARLNELLSAKAQVRELNDKLKQVKEDLRNQNLEKSQIEEEIGQLQGEMLDLQEKLLVSEDKKNMKDKEIKMLQSKLHLLANQITPLEAEFKKIVASPL